jgi:hypothetical protein
MMLCERRRSGQQRQGRRYHQDTFHSTSPSLRPSRAERTS